MWTAIIALLAKSSLARHALSILLAVGLTAGLFWWFLPPRTTIVERPGPTVEKIVYVDRPVLKTEYVTKYLDPPSKLEVQKVMAENAFLENEVTRLNDTIAKLKSTGTGTIQYVEVPVPGQTVTRREATFKDWRLDFKAVDKVVNYTLDQKFEAVTSVGRDKQGKEFVNTKLLEIGPGETRTALENVKATTVIASATSNGKHWIFNGAIQGGFAFSYDIAAKKSVPGGIIGVKWLTRGYTKAAEDGIFSVLTPAVYISSKVEPALLPVSVNFGRVPKQPFRDLWLSPLIGFTMSGGVSRYGVVFTGTF